MAGGKRPIRRGATLWLRSSDEPRSIMKHIHSVFLAAVSIRDNELVGLTSTGTTGTMARCGSAKTSPLRPQHWRPAAQTKVSTLKKEPEHPKSVQPLTTLPLLLDAGGLLQLLSTLSLASVIRGHLRAWLPTTMRLPARPRPLLLPRPDHLAPG